MAKLTKRTVDALKPQAKAYVAYDSELHGFGVRVMPSGHKSFIVEYRPHGGGRSVATRRLTLGALGGLTTDQARRAAQEALAGVRLGNDPQAEKIRQRASATVGGLIDAFLEGHARSKLKAKTVGHYRIALERLRAAHGSLKAHALTRTHLAALHMSQRETPFAANRFLATVSKCFSWGAHHGLLPEAAIRLLILTGARLREILDAKWQHADFERGILFLPDSKTGPKPVYLGAAALAILASLPRLEGNPHIVAGMKDGAPRADLKKPWAAVTKAAGRLNPSAQRSRRLWVVPRGTSCRW